jgi:hypothetical protein
MTDDEERHDIIFYIILLLGIVLRVVLLLVWYGMVLVQYFLLSLFVGDDVWMSVERHGETKKNNGLQTANAKRRHLF